METIKERLVSLNPWHLDPNFRQETSKTYRDLFCLLTETFIDKDVSLSISGLRRTGKTTILFQLINYLLDHQAENLKIVYFQFSEESRNLEQVLTFFFSRFSDKEVLTNKFYIFLDELQYVKDWQTILKGYIDRNSKIKFVVTGSASIYFHSRIKESLAGRILDFRLDPLSFSEMIRLKENYKELSSIDRVLKEEKDNQETFKALSFDRLPFKKLLGSYLRFGEFPALLPYLDDEVYAQKYLEDGIIYKILQKDIRLFEVEKQEEIAALYKICCSNMAQMINLRNVAAETDLSYPTIKKYVSVLTKTFLIDRIKNRLRSVRAQTKSMEKVFSCSLNLASTVLSLADPLNPPYLDFKGHVIENFIYNSLKKLGPLYYYNQAGKEVDLILELNDNILPFEVKSSASLKKTDFNHLLNFLSKNHLTSGYVVYGGEIDFLKIAGKTIFLLPYWMF